VLVYMGVFQGEFSYVVCTCEEKLDLNIITC
jgi:hypothetical protein